jgi:hypothetical protein
LQLCKFETEGQELAGHLLKLGDAEIADKDNAEQVKQVPGALVITEDGVPFKFLLTYQLQQKIRAKHIGHFVVIRFETTKKIREDQSPMQMYKVTYSKDREFDDAMIAAKLDDIGIFSATDDDIPF